MTTYSPVTTETKTALDEFDALWITHHPANWALPTDPKSPPQEMLLDQLWLRDTDSLEEYDGVAI